MCKNPLREAQMTDAVYIEQASGWARWLTQREARCPGDMEGAWRRLERRYGLPARLFWALRYRPPKTLSVSLYTRMKHAIDAECERQFQLLEHEIKTTKAAAGPNHPAVRAAEALFGEDYGK